MKVAYPAGGWLPPRAHLELEWDDQGRDLATNWGGVLQAPGRGECIAVHSDRPFPNGFGPHYPVVRIDTGPWAGHEYYLGHTTALVRVGDKFEFGHPLARADQGHNWAGTHGGWVELGEAFGGTPGPKAASHWFDHLIEHPYIVNVPERPIRFGMQGLRVLGMTSRLRDCGYLPRPYWRFGRVVHGAVVAFKRHHHLPLGSGDRGVVDERTDVVLKHASQWCKRHHRKEV